MIVSSKQTEENFSSSGFGFSFGGGVGKSGFGNSKNGNNIGGGFNLSQGDMHRLWVDDITTIKGTDSITVNVGKDLNLTGAAILSDNLALAVTGNINKKDLNDSYYSESMGIGFSQNLTTNGNQPTIPGTGGKPNQAPGGSTSINANYSQNESSRTVYATIGSLSDYNNGKLKLTSATKDVTGGDFEGGISVDHRLLSKSGRKDIGRQLNYSRLLVQAPVEDGIKLMKSDEQDKMSKLGGILATDTVGTTRLFLNKDITAQQLAGDKNTLITYDGNSLSDSADAKNVRAFYDHEENVVGLNASKTGGLSNQELAAVIGHEAIGHGIGGTSEYIANNTTSHINRIWDTFQSDNTSFQLALPSVTSGYNNYANSIILGPNVSPLRDVSLVQGMTENSNNFGPRWKDPITNKSTQKPVEGKTSRPHQGNDLSAPKGSIINSAFDGKVTDSRFMNGYGNTVVVEGKDPSTGNKVWALYGHMSEPSKLTVGTSVMEGQKIGLVGNTGSSSEGNHLHFGINKGNSSGIDFKNGWVNPNGQNFGKYENLKDTPAYQQGKSQ